MRLLSLLDRHAPLLAARLRHWLRLETDHGSVSLNQRRIYILPSRAGLGFALALLAMFIGSINYNLGLGYALVFLLVGLALAGMLATFRNLLGLTARPGRSEAVFAGDEAILVLHLHNPDPSPKVSLQLLAPNLQSQAPLHLAADEQRRVELRLPASQRGYLTLPRLRLESRYPLGLFVAWSVFRFPWQVLVYPRPLDWPLPPPQATDTRLGHSGPHGEDDFAGLRDRQPTDPLHHVAWKSATRWPVGEPVERPLPVKQFSGGQASELWDFRWDSFPPDCDLETRLSVLTGWVITAAAADQRYALTLPSHALPLGNGPQHRQQCLEALALFALPPPHGRH